MSYTCATSRRKAAAKADKLATTPTDWQRIFDAEMERLNQKAKTRQELRAKGVQIRPKHWKYDGDLSSAPTRHCTLDHLARQNGDPI